MKALPKIVMPREELIEALEARRQWAQRLDASALRKHEAHERRFLAAWRKGCSAAAKWDYETLKANYAIPVGAYVTTSTQSDESHGDDVWYVGGHYYASDTDTDAETGEIVIVHLLVGNHHGLPVLVRVRAENVRAVERLVNRANVRACCETIHRAVATGRVGRDVRYALECALPVLRAASEGRLG